MSRKRHHMKRVDFMNEFYDKVMSHDKIYSLLYSPERTSEPIEDQIFEMETSKLEWWDKENGEFVYTWGRIFGEYNRYTQDTYGKGWAFTKEEIVKAWAKG